MYLTDQRRRQSFKKMSIKLENIFKEYHNGEVTTKVLKGVSCTIENGEFVSIMGPSGSGKSTLMHIMGFLDRPSSGGFWFDHNDVSLLEDDKLAELRNQKIGFVFQAFYLLPNTNIFENVRLPLVYSKRPIKEHHALVKEAVESVGLTHRIFHFGGQLSGGEKQRVAIARALVNKPYVIFADEPTGNLDSQSGLQILRILQKLHQDGKTIVLVTHETITAEHAERIIHIRDGKIESDKKVLNRRFVETIMELK